jgi:hypothetical protein
MELPIEKPRAAALAWRGAFVMIAASGGLKKCREVSNDLCLHLGEACSHR